MSLIGHVRFAWGGRALDLRNQKACAMLAYLSLSEGGSERRDRLAGLLWGDSPERQARAALRQTLHELRQAILQAGGDCLVSDRASIGLRPGSFSVDVTDMLAAVAERRVPAVLLRQPRVIETLLDGFEDVDPTFNAWLRARRQILQDRFVSGLEDAYRSAALSPPERRRLAEATLLLDPTHEEACRVVMRAAAEAGDPARAERVFKELCRLLADDYDAVPNDATLNLMADIRLGSCGPAPPEPQPAAPALAYAAEVAQALVSPRRAVALAPPPLGLAKPALFVERFAISGVGADQVHLVDGFRFELIARLTHFREWYVAGHDGGGAAGGAAASGGYGLATTAYQAGATINVVMVLTEKLSGVAIWGERFELRLENWFDVQQRLVRRIAATLNVQLSTERLARMASIPDVSLEAYDIWLRAQMVINGYQAGDWNRTALMLAQAIERTPNFSPLYSSLAQMNNVVHFVQPGLFRTEEATERTVSLAQKAVALDPLDSRAALCLGWALTFARRPAAAKAYMDIACDLNGFDSWTLMSSAMFHAFTGEAARAAQLSAQSMELTLSPTVSHWTFLASIRFLAGDDEGTLVAGERARFGLPTVAAWRAAALSNLGRAEAARAERATFLAEVRAAWAGPEPAAEATATRWLLHLYPLSCEADRQRLRNGLAAAGLIMP